MNIYLVDMLDTREGNNRKSKGLTICIETYMKYPSSVSSKGQKLWGKLIGMSSMPIFVIVTRAFIIRFELKFLDQIVF